MKERNQVSNYTEYNRTPEIFQASSLLPVDLPSKVKILSFGCSSGLETTALNNLYFPNADIHGYDIDKEIIKNNILENKYNNIRYFDNPDLLSSDYNLIFCMSVLCRWPDGQANYKFTLFEETLKLLDKRLKVGGYLVIYNAQYLFNDTVLSNRYSPVKLNYIDSGFVTKWDRNFKNIISDNQDVIYKKNSDGEND